MDVLSDVLDLVRLKGYVYFVTDLGAPWGMRMDAGPFAPFHVMVRGQGWLKVADRPHLFSAGDVVMLPFGDAHDLADRPDGAKADYVRGREVLDGIANGTPLFQTDAASARLLCGHFEFDRGVPHPLIEELPHLIHLSGLATRDTGWFDAVLPLLVRETDTPRPGSAALINRLAEALFIQVLRAYLADHRPPQGFLAALDDPQVFRALQYIHAEAESGLSLARIAAAAGMSRSNLAARFKETLGLTPMAYATQWRMLKARELLALPGLGLADIAARVGYASEAAFSRAFSRTFRQTPGAFRRHKTTVETLENAGRSGRLEEDVTTRGP